MKRRSFLAGLAAAPIVGPTAMKTSILSTETPTVVSTVITTGNLPIDEWPMIKNYWPREYKK